MKKSKNQSTADLKELKKAILSELIKGIDPENDPAGVIDDIIDNSSYAVDIAIKLTAEAIYNDVTKQIYPLVSGDHPKECPAGVLIKFVELMDKWKRP